MASILPAYVAWRAGTTNSVIVQGHQATQADGISALQSIPGLLKRLQIRAMCGQERMVEIKLTPRRRN
jgi:hypothetical protein